MVRLSLLAILLLCGCARAQQPTPALELMGRVVDKAGLIDPATEIALSARLARLERETGAQLVIATTPGLDGKDIATYSLELARAWRIGDKDRNDGLLLLVAPNERKVRIEVGTGLESVMKDEICSDIIQRLMLPYLRAGDAQQAILAGTGGILDVMHYRPAKRSAA
ncbi:hypothetical protein MBESOW_P0749 [Sphingobium xenophagum]|uniref:TPM domain-containing protein n=1 Tax=Sphingobium xenophagum TaxID=121428 RepID=A0A401IYS1_SPHXE|nr:hypothetical protein MBESOW_P0749 [Sphingobium xenophagum]